jgi:indolepyruvate ferredoxin oxidoreductase, beta subunit
MSALHSVDVVLAGVGGQGSVLATQILGQAAVLAGMPVVTSEVHGMSQRGGSVVTAVRLGRVDAPPVVPAGSADYLVGFEPLEGLRQLGMLHGDGTAIIAEETILPVIESLRGAPYPDEIEQLARSVVPAVLMVPASGIAADLGNTRLASTVLLGVLSVYLDALPEDAWHRAIAQSVPAHTVDSNLAAFARGAGWRVAREKAVTAF